ncbi:MAG: radical SAM protein, partial [Desulfovibrionaceae bacterium]|nr:radical SAM protein [Desulfovibrionaceae bacterium]
PPRPLIPDLDTLPLPDYARVQDFSRYAPGVFAHKTLPVAGVITSRGCPNRCTFCDRSVFGQKLRQRSPENIAEEIILLYHKHGIREFNFLDDTFTINGAKRFPPLFSLLKQEGIRFPWSCSTRINAVDENLLRFMKEHGCWYISFGIESGDADILKRIQKNLNMEQARQVLGACRRLGITTKGFFIVGHPGETKESIERSMQFALSLPLDQVGVFINTPLPGTEQFDTASRYGSLAPTDWRMYNMHNPVFVPTGLTEECLTESRRLFMRRFFVRPGTILRFSKLFWGKGGVTRLLSVVRALPFLFFPQRVDGKTA